MIECAAEAKAEVSRPYHKSGGGLTGYVFVLTEPHPVTAYIVAKRLTSGSVAQPSG